MSKLEEEIEKVSLVYGNMICDMLTDSLKKALGKPQESRLQFEPKWDKESKSLLIVASEEYWYYIDKGRGKTQRSGDGAVRKGVGKKWQNSLNIDPREVIYNIQLKYNQKKGLNWKPKRLDFNTAANQLSYLIARKIHKFGYKPKPFVDRVLKSGIIDQYSKKLGEVMGREITIELTRP